MSYVALMYHAVYGSAHAREKIPTEDLPYAVSVDAFDAQLTALAGHSVLLTFDDGDEGWVLEALPVLKKHGVSGLFFVTPLLIGTSGYCNWEQIRQLVDEGHEIGAHGYSHKFLPDLELDECFRELMQSRKVIEEHINIPVTSMSFPGGRYGAREVNLAKEAGFLKCYTSEPGKISVSDYCQRRVAVRAETNVAWLLDVASGRTLVWLRIKLSYTVKSILKKFLGNRGYHELYRLIRG